MAYAPEGTYGASIPGANPDAVESLLEQLRGYRQKGGQMLSGVKEEALKPGGMFKNAGGEYRGAMGGKSSAALGGIGTLLSGDPLGALVSTPVGIGAGAIANRAITAATQPLMALGPYGKAAGMGLRFAAPALIGSTVQQGVANAVGGFKAKAQEAGQYPGGPEISIGGVPVTESARYKQQQEQMLAMEIKQAQARGGTQLGLDRERLEMQRADALERIKGQLPYIQQLKNQDLVRQQAINASNTTNSLALGRQAGSFGLAKDSQQQAADIFRTALANNPYANSGMAQPTLNYNIG